MTTHDSSIADTVIHAMADAHPNPLHFGYLSLALRISAGAMLRTLRQLKAGGLIELDRSSAASDVPFGRARISAKGLAAVATLRSRADDTHPPVRRAEGVVPALPRVVAPLPAFVVGRSGNFAFTANRA